MFFVSYRHLKKGSHTTSKGKTISKASAKGVYHYITRTAHFKNGKENEHVEHVEHGCMPSWAQHNPSEFWKAADDYERSNARVATTLVIALPKELTKKQRIELAKSMIQKFCKEHQYPFSASIHNHTGALEGIDQPHLHILYSERALDGVERDPALYFKQPQGGGCKKITADILGFGKEYVKHVRQEVETLTNMALQQYAPTKKVTIEGYEIEVENKVSCLSTKEYNEKYNTKMKEIKMIHPEILYSNKAENMEKLKELQQEIQLKREENRAWKYADEFRNQIGRYPIVYLNDYNSRVVKEKSNDYGYGF